MKIQDALNRFINYQLVLGNTEKTVKAYISHINQFITYMDNSNIKDINYNDYENYIIYLRTKDIESVTIHSYAQSLKTFLKYCYENGFIKENIYERIKLPRYKKKAIEILSESDIDRLLNYFNPYSFLGARNNLIITLMLDAGLRLNEVVNLSMIDFNIEKRLIKINGKGQKQRYVPLTDRIYEAFKIYIACFDNKFAPLHQLFVDINGFAINQECIKSFFRKIRRDLELPQLHPHLLRHTFATLFLMNGGDPLSLQLMLGHTTLTMTQKYVHFATEMQLVKQMIYSPLSNKKEPLV